MHTNQVIHGDCLEVMKRLDENSVDSIVTDPPYELGFMGKSWDNTGIANNKEMWKECLRVLKPGGHLLSFGGTRTYHRMASAIEDAGFEVRDMIEWVYSTGFPKSLNVFKQLKKKCECGNMEVYENRTKQVGASSEQEAEYFLRFMQERDLSQTQSSKEKQWKVLQSGLSEQSSHRTVQGEEPKESSIRREERILERGNNLQKTEGKLQGSDLPEMSEEVSTDGEKRRIHNATQTGDGSTSRQTIDENGSSASRRPQSEQQQYREPCAFCKQWGTQAIRTLGVGTATKPSHEPICMARKPLSEKSVAENCLKWGTGGINIDESRVGTDENITIHKGNKFGGIAGTTPETFKTDGQNLGRFPANLIHDNSEEVRECFPETKQPSFRNGDRVSNNNGLVPWNKGRETGREVKGAGFTDTGNASRFFKSIIYQAKASKSDRGQGNNHPTVKPIALMEYLIKMVTKPGGIVLDPFAGSGSTLVAAKQNGYDYIGIELTEEYIPIIKARLSLPD